MTCPREIAEIVVDILQAGLLAIRAAAWEGNAERCAIEADHLHNLADFLRNYSPAKLKYYWETERPAFLSRMSATTDAPNAFGPLWHKLEVFVARACSPAVSN
jgi:hypothetical protein